MEKDTISKTKTIKVKEELHHLLKQIAIKERKNLQELMEQIITNWLED